MGSEWDEIKRLAADFQKIQLSSTLQRLSERNCIEIVALLSEKGLLDVIFTNDGKEYITPEHLEREINDELYVHGGRVNLVEISKILNVDLSKIETIAEKIAAKNDNIHYMLGQLIDEDYIMRMAVEINEKLAQSGEMSVSDLTILFDLPSEFLQHKVVEKHLGKIIRGKQDPSNPRIIYTQSYILRCKSKIRGALAAITRPIPVSVVVQQIKVHERVFHSLIDEISPAGTIISKLSSAQYVPNIYAKSQTDWVNSFYNQNGFLEYDSIVQLGISDPKQYIKKQFPSENLLFLKQCAVGPKITDLAVTTAINECNTTKSYIDLSTILPSVMTQEDIDDLYSNLITSNIQSNFVFLESVVFSKDYLNNLIAPCHEIAVVNAKHSIETGSYQQYLAEKQLGTSRGVGADVDHAEGKTDKREERRKKATHGKGGGGVQGRETKTKSTKKHFRGGEKSLRDSDDEEQSKKSKSQTFELISMEEIEKVIYNKLEDEGLEHLSTQIASIYHPNLNQLAMSTAQSLYEASPQTHRRQTHAALQEKLNILLVDIRLYEKGLKILPVDVQSQLVKYLLKTLGNDVCNEIFVYVANECSLNVKNMNLNADQRNKICLESGPEYKSVLMELNKAVAGASIDDFLTSAENAIKSCGMIIKKVDKKKDKALIVEHKEKLNQQLLEASDPAIILHLATLKIFTSVTNTILHASGRHVSHILRYLQTHLNFEQNQILMQFHDLVLKVLNAVTESGEEEQEAVLQELGVIQKQVIDLAVAYDKQMPRSDQ